MAAEKPEQVDKLRQFIQDWDKHIQRGQETGEQLNEADIEALRSLGYLE